MLCSSECRRAAAVIAALWPSPGPCPAFSVLSPRPHATCSQRHCARGASGVKEVWPPLREAPHPQNHQGQLLGTADDAEGGRRVARRCRCGKPARPSLFSTLLGAMSVSTRHSKGGGIAAVKSQARQRCNATSLADAAACHLSAAFLHPSLLAVVGCCRRRGGTL
jgi:hypothetical protein